MTDEETLDAEKLNADMRNVLTVLTGTTDADKLVDLVNEKLTSMFSHLNELYVQHRSALMSGPDMDMANAGLGMIISTADMASLQSEYKARLIDTVAKWVPIVDAALDKIAQALRELEAK
jgi:hypothetical protein